MFDDVCRLCLQNEDLVWIFDKRIVCPENMQDVIYCTTGVNIMESDKVTQKVCYSCCEITIKMYRFRETSLRNDEDLKGAVRGRFNNISNLMNTISNLKKSSTNKAFKNDHPSIKLIRHVYPKLRLPRYLPTHAHFLPCITVMTNEVSEWLTEHGLPQIAVESKKRRLQESESENTQCEKKQKAKHSTNNRMITITSDILLPKMTVPCTILPNKSSTSYKAQEKNQISKDNITKYGNTLITPIPTKKVVRKAPTLPISDYDEEEDDIFLEDSDSESMTERRRFPEIQSKPNSNSSASRDFEPDDTDAMLIDSSLKEKKGSNQNPLRGKSIGDRERSISNASSKSSVGSKKNPIASSGTKKKSQIQDFVLPQKDQIIQSSIVVDKDANDQDLVVVKVSTADFKAKVLSKAQNADTPKTKQISKSSSSETIKDKQQLQIDKWNASIKKYMTGERENEKSASDKKVVDGAASKLKLKLNNIHYNKISSGSVNLQNGQSAELDPAVTICRTLLTTKSPVVTSPLPSESNKGETSSKGKEATKNPQSSEPKTIQASKDSNQALSEHLNSIITSLVKGNVNSDPEQQPLTSSSNSAVDSSDKNQNVDSDKNDFIKSLDLAPKGDGKAPNTTDSQLLSTINKSSTIYTCQICESIFNTIKELKMHERKHSRQCNKCKKKFSSSTSLIEHFKKDCQLSQIVKIVMQKVDTMPYMKNKYRSAFEVADDESERIDAGSSNLDNITSDVNDRVTGDTELEHDGPEMDHNNFEFENNRTEDVVVDVQQNEDPDIVCISDDDDDYEGMPVLRSILNDDELPKPTSAAPVVPSINGHAQANNNSTNGNENSASEVVRDILPRIKIINDSILPMVDYKRKDTEVLKDLLKSIKFQNQDKVIQLKRLQQCKIMDVNKSKLIKNLRREIGRYKIPIKVSHGTWLDLSFNTNAPLEKPPKRDLWYNLKPLDLLGKNQNSVLKKIGGSPSDHPTDPSNADQTYSLRDNINSMMKKVTGSMNSVPQVQVQQRKFSSPLHVVSNSGPNSNYKAVITNVIPSNSGYLLLPSVLQPAAIANTNKPNVSQQLVFSASRKAVTQSGANVNVSSTITRPVYVTTSDGKTLISQMSTATPITTTNVTATTSVLTAVDPATSSSGNAPLRVRSIWELS